MKKVLTAKTLDALKGKEKRYDVHDLLCPGFSVRVSENGRKVFSIKYRFGIEQKRVTLGIYPRISLATARKKRWISCARSMRGSTRRSSGAGPT